MNVTNMPTKAKFNSHKEGIQIVKIAAFCFAIVSWIATAQGLREYVFVHNDWQAYMISFAIQAILFVFNLKLPEYFSKISANRVAAFLMVAFYVVTLLASSFFSFVYMANLTYSDTRYIDANIALDAKYRGYLDQADQFAIESTSYYQILVSKKASELQAMIPANQNASAQRSESDLRADVSVKQQAYDDAKTNVEYWEKELEVASNTYYTPMDQRWRDLATYADEKKVYEGANNALESAKKARNKAKHDLDMAEQALEQYVPSAPTAVAELLVQMMKPSPDVETLESSIVQLNTLVIEMGENGTTVINFAQIVATTQELNVALSHYLRVREALSAVGENNDIEDFKNGLLRDDIAIPVPASPTEDFESQRTNWESTWKTRFTSLEKTIKSLPSYSETTDDEIKEVVNTKVLSDFEPQKIADDIDKVTRSNLANINALERACGLLGNVS